MICDMLNAIAKWTGLQLTCHFDKQRQGIKELTLQGKVDLIKERRILLKKILLFALAVVAATTILSCGGEESTQFILLQHA